MMHRGVAESLAHSAGQGMRKLLGLPPDDKAMGRIARVGCLRITVIPARNGGYALQGLWNPYPPFSPFLPAYATPEMATAYEVDRWLQGFTQDVGLAARRRVLDFFSRGSIWDANEVKVSIDTASRLLSLPFLWSFWEGDPLIPHSSWVFHGGGGRVKVNVDIEGTGEAWRGRLCVDEHIIRVFSCRTPEAANVYLLEGLLAPDSMFQRILEQITKEPPA